MLEYRAEGLCRNANHLSREELSRCMTSGEVLQSTALAYDTGHRLRFELGGLRGIMPFADCVDAAPGETVKDIAVLTRVGRPTCFVIMGTEFDENGEEYYLLSRAEAQRRCRAQYLDTLEAGSVIPCTVTHIENFGAFCDIGCGIAALLPIDCLSVSRIASPADRVQVGQQLAVGGHRQRGVIAALAGDVADALVLFARRSAVQQRCALVGQKARNTAQQRGFPGTILTQHAHDLPVRHGEVRPQQAHGLAVTAVGLLQIFYLDHSCLSRSFS